MDLVRQPRGIMVKVWDGQDDGLGSLLGCIEVMIGHKNHGAGTPGSRVMSRKV